MWTRKKRRRRKTKTTWWVEKKGREMIIQEEMGIAARRYSWRDRRLGAIPLPESVFLFITFQESGRMAEITFGFPSVFQRWVSLPCGQVQSTGRGALVRKNCFHFVFFFVVYDVWRRR